MPTGRRGGWKVKTTNYLYQRETVMGGSTTTNRTLVAVSQRRFRRGFNKRRSRTTGSRRSRACSRLQQYQGQMVADVSPQMQQAWNHAANSGNVGQARSSTRRQAGYLGRARQTPQQVHGADARSTRSAAYMNPYTQNVINKTLPIMQQNWRCRRISSRTRPTPPMLSAVRGRAIQQGVTQAQGAHDMAQMAAQLNQANFGQAQAAAQATSPTLKAQQQPGGRPEQGNQQQSQAGAGLGTLGNQQMQNNLANYGMLTSAGGLQQQQAAERHQRPDRQVPARLAIPAAATWDDGDRRSA